MKMKPTMQRLLDEIAALRQEVAELRAREQHVHHHYHTVSKHWETVLPQPPYLPWTMYCGDSPPPFPRSGTCAAMGNYGDLLSPLQVFVETASSHEP